MHSLLSAVAVQTHTEARAEHRSSAWHNVSSWGRRSPLKAASLIREAGAHRTRFHLSTFRSGVEGPEIRGVEKCRIQPLCARVMKVLVRNLELELGRHLCTLRSALSRSPEKLLCCCLLKVLTAGDAFWRASMGQVIASGHST